MPRGCLPSLASQDRQLEPLSLDWKWAIEAFGQKLMHEEKLLAAGTARMGRELSHGNTHPDRTGRDSRAGREGR